MNWSELLLLAVGIAISPIPIAAIILTMMSNRGITNGLGFLTGWLLALGLVTGAGSLLISELATPEQSSSSSLPIVRIVFGIALIILAIHFGWQYAKRDRDQPKVPAWLKMLDTFNPTKSGILGFTLTIANVKNLPLSIEAAATLSKVTNQAGMALLGLVTFISIASLGVATPLVAAHLGKQAATELLQRWKRWLQNHNAIILCTLFSILGLRALLRGISGI